MTKDAEAAQLARDMGKAAQGLRLLYESIGTRSLFNRTVENHLDALKADLMAAGWVDEDCDPKL